MNREAAKSIAGAAKRLAGEVARAKSWSPRGDKCPICKQAFRECPHTIDQVHAHFDVLVLRAGQPPALPQPTPARREWATTTGAPGDNPSPPDGDGWDLRGAYVYEVPPSWADRRAPPTMTVAWAWQREVPDGG